MTDHCGFCSVVCRALLESDRAITQTNERTLIKQLGMWLGLLTFAKNKPVLAKDMDLKALIQDAYTRGRMIAVLPFVEKVLAGCKDTKVRARRPLDITVPLAVSGPLGLPWCAAWAWLHD